MGFGEAVSTCLRKYVGFSGRARRSEFWWFVLFGFLVGIAASFVDGLIGSHPLTPGGSGPVASLASIALFLPQLAVTVRRLHDTNRSGLWLLGFYAFFVVVVVVAVMSLFSGAVQIGGASPVLAIACFAILLAALIWYIVIMCQKGTEGTNRFGPDPFAANQAEVFT
jgi:uncharacterized membrane protein YhaH (DUF805 family)